MSMTVKKLISELEKIENKYLEVECYLTINVYKPFEIDLVKKSDKKVFIFTKNGK